VFSQGTLAMHVFYAGIADFTGNINGKIRKDNFFE
jgi:hypothetical protein